jgi:hypothetical protein
MLSKANRGLYPSGAKLGYIVDHRTKKLLPDPKTHHLIAQLFDLYATGYYPLSKLSDVMFRKGLTNRSGNPLVKAQLVEIIKDPLYYGAFIWGGELYSGIHKPAVSKALWDKAQAVYRQRSRPHSRKTEKHVFNNFLRCGTCGFAITAEEHIRLQKNGNLNRWQYYRCTKKSDKQKCSQPYVRQADLLTEFENIIRQVALPDDWAIPMLEQVESWSLSETSRASAQLALLDADLKKIEAKLRRLTDLVLEGDLDRAEYRSRKAALIEEKAAKFEARKLIARQGAKYWLEPLRELISAVWERNLPTAGGDLLKLRDFVAKVGSNLRLNSRKVLWNWNSPYALLAERASSLNWSCLLAKLRTHFEHTM